MRRARERPGYDESQEPNQVARRARRQAAKAAKSTSETPARDAARGTFRPGNPGGGRKKGSLDTRPRIQTIKAVFQYLFEHKNAFAKMVDAIDRGIQAEPRTAIQYLNLAARVLDKRDDTQGRVVYFHLHTTVNPYALEKARKTQGLPPLARRVEGSRDGGATSSLLRPEAIG